MCEHDFRLSNFYERKFSSIMVNNGFLWCVCSVSTKGAEIKLLDNPLYLSIIDKDGKYTNGCTFCLTLIPLIIDTLFS